MNTTSSSPFSGIGGFLQLVAFAVSVALGFKAVPAITGIFVGAVLFEIAYVVVRFPQMSGVWARDGIKIVKLVFLQLILNAMIAMVFYWIGRGIARLFV